MAVAHPHEALRDVLLSDAGVIAITTTIKPWTLWRTSELPAITYHSISRAGSHHYEGRFAWAQRRYQLKCWSSDYDESQALAAAVIEAVDGYAAQTHGSILIHRLRADDHSDIFDAPPAGQEQPPYGSDVDVLMAYERIS